MTTETTDTTDYKFTPLTLRILATSVRDLREEMLFNVDDAGADPTAEQHLLAALSHLDLAYRSLKLASLAQSAALAQTGAIK